MKIEKGRKNYEYTYKSINSSSFYNEFSIYGNECRFICL